MKKATLCLLFILFTVAGIGQLAKRTWLAGGMGTFYSYNGTFTSPSYNYTTDYTEIEVSATVGYLVANKVALGLRPSFSSIKGEVTSPGGLSTNIKRFAIGPFSRYYFLKQDKPFNIVGDVSYQIGLMDFGGEENGKIHTFSAMAGPVIFFNSAVGLEVLLGYRSTKEDLEETSAGYMDIRKGFQVGIGFQIHLEKE